MLRLSLEVGGAGDVGARWKRIEEMSGRRRWEGGPIISLNLTARIQYELQPEWRRQSLNLDG